MSSALSNLLIVVALWLSMVFFCSTGGSDKPPTANTTPQGSNSSLTHEQASPVEVKSRDTATSNETQRLARAAEVRSYMREQEIPATVVASGTELSIQYEAASGDFLPEIFQTFCRQQNTAGLRTAGFETIEIRARDSAGTMQSRTFLLSDCKK